MREPISKLRFIGLPLVGISASFIFAYSALHWVLLVALPDSMPDSELVRFFLPLAAPWIPILVWLRPRIKCLRWYREASTGYMLAWMAIVGPAICAQFWVEATAGKLTVASRPEQIDLTHTTRFYAFEELAVDKDAARSVVHTNTSGKHSEYWTIIIDIAAPLAKGKRNEPANVWLGARYETSMRSALTPDEKRQRITQFTRNVTARFNADDFRRAYFSVCSDRKQRHALLEAMSYSPRSTEADAVTFLCPHNTPFAQRGEGALKWTIILFLGGSMLWCAIISFLRIDTANYRRWKTPDHAENRKARRWELDFILPTKDYLATPLLAGAILVVWACMAWAGDGLFAADAKALLGWGAVYGSLVMEGAYWRLLTGMFVHANLVHLMNNLVGLVCAGAFVEKRFGHTWLLATFLLGGLGGSLWSIHWNSDRVSVGASGAIFGIVGFAVVMILALRKRFASERRALLLVAAGYLGFNLLIGLLPHVDLAAHVGGTLAGAMIGIFALLFISDETPPRNKKNRHKPTPPSALKYPVE